MNSVKIDLRDLLEAGCHFGHQVRRWNPKMKGYIYTQRDGVHIFDLAKTAEKLEEAMVYVRDFVAQGHDVVLVGTKRQACDIIREEALKVGAPFVSVRWLGGTLTNWDEIQKRIKKLKRMKSERDEGKYDHYTKKEKVLMNREISRLERFFGGIADLPGKPEALFVVDTKRETTAVTEATLTNVPVVGMVDTNADPTLVKYPIPVNDDAVRSIKLVVTKIAEAYAEGKAMRKGVKPASTTAAAKKVKEEKEAGAKKGTKKQRK